MARDVSKVATLAVELASYTATFTALGLALVGESWSNGQYAVNATKAGVSFGTPQADINLKAAVNALVAVLGIKPTSNHPYFP